MGEFELIRKLQKATGSAAADRSGSVAVGIGDDAAVLNIPPQQQLVVTVDTLVAGVHFPLKTAPEDIGHKALAVNLSDLAAMGADARWFFLALTLPEASKSELGADWLDAFVSGMAALASESGVVLAGGDTTSGPLSITITALGLVEAHQALLRSTAAADELVVVSGVPGLAALGLSQLRAGTQPDVRALHALNRPQPRLELGKRLHATATACIDISDGLLADLTHITTASNVGAEIWLERLPVVPELQALDFQQRWELQLSGGDDYELCFTLEQEQECKLPALAAAAGVPLTVVGRTTGNPGVRCLRADGSDYHPARTGYEHFAEPVA